MRVSVDTALTRGPMDCSGKSSIREVWPSGELSTGNGRAIRRATVVPAVGRSHNPEIFSMTTRLTGRPVEVVSGAVKAEDCPSVVQSVLRAWAQTDAAKGKFAGLSA